MGTRGPEASKANARERIGNVQIHKGATRGGIPVVMWDAIPQCEPDQCRMEENCPYTHTGKCSVRLKYMNHVYDSLMGQVDGSDPGAVFQVGLILVPLYGQLIQFKMEEYGSTVMKHANNGKSYVNPIFKEIRETIKVITSVMKDLKRSNSMDGDTQRDNMLHGSDGYYDSLFEDDGTEVHTKKRNKV